MPSSRAVLVAVGFSICSLVPAPGLAQTPAAQSPAPEVRITLSDGARRTGQMVSLGATEIAIRRGRSWETRYKLSEVQLVETVHHNTRNLTLAGLGIGLGLAMDGDWCGSGQSYASSTEPECISAAPALVAAAGAGLGAVLGHVIDKRQRRILFAAPLRTMIRGQVTPIRRGAGIGVTMTW